MTAAHFRDVVLTGLGGYSKLVSGASVFVYAPGTATQVTCYSDSGLTTALTQPLTADANGVLNFYLPAQRYVDLSVSGTGVVTSVISNVYVPNVDVTDRAGQLFNVKAYGAVPYGGNAGPPTTAQINANTAAIQAAMTAAGKYGVIYFPDCGADASGNQLYYPVNSTLNWDQGQVLLGDGIGCSNIIWFGAAGGTMITRVGGNSFGTARGLTIGGRGILSYDQQTALWPGKIFDFTSIQSAVDYGVRLSYLFTGYCSGDAWSVPGSYTNFWADHIRWQAVVGYWINVTGGSGFSLSNFSLDTFTCDMAPATPSQWGFRFDASAGSASGPIVISNARIESTGGALASNSATVTLVSNTTAGPQWNLKLENLAIDKGGSTTGTYSLINHIGNVNGGQLSFDVECVRFGFTPSTPLIIGNLPASLVQPALASDLNKWVFMGQPQIFGNGIVVNNLPAFSASAKYVVVDANGVLRVSALGPAS